LTSSPKASPVWASVSSLSHPPKSHARFSFGVKLNLTIFLLESEIQSPLHFWFRVKPTVEFCSPKKYSWVYNFSDFRSPGNQKNVCRMYQVIRRNTPATAVSRQPQTTNKRTMAVASGFADFDTTISNSFLGRISYLRRRNPLRASAPATQ
jgi:hypothetical protein